MAVSTAILKYAYSKIYLNKAVKNMHMPYGLAIALEDIYPTEMCAPGYQKAYSGIFTIALSIRVKNWK